MYTDAATIFFLVGASLLELAYFYARLQGVSVCEFHKRLAFTVLVCQRQSLCND